MGSRTNMNFDPRRVAAAASTLAQATVRFVHAIDGDPERLATLASIVQIEAELTDEELEATVEAADRMLAKITEAADPKDALDAFTLRHTKRPAGTQLS